MDEFGSGPLRHHQAPSTGQPDAPLVVTTTDNFGFDEMRLTDSPPADRTPQSSRSPASSMGTQPRSASSMATLLLESDLEERLDISPRPTRLEERLHVTPRTSPLTAASLAGGQDRSSPSPMREERLGISPRAPPPTPASLACLAGLAGGQDRSGAVAPPTPSSHAFGRYSPPSPEMLDLSAFPHLLESTPRAIRGQGAAAVGGPIPPSSPADSTSYGGGPIPPPSRHLDFDASTSAAAAAFMPPTFDRNPGWQRPPQHAVSPRSSGMPFTPGSFPPTPMDLQRQMSRQMAQQQSQMAHQMAQQIGQQPLGGGYHFPMHPMPPGFNPAMMMMAPPPLPTMAMGAEATLPSSSPAMTESRMIRNGPFKPGRECKFCRNNGESPESYRSHVLRNPSNGQLICPVLREHKCEMCGATGDNAHTRSYCPKVKAEQKKSLPTLLKETKRQSDGTIRKKYPSSHK